RNIFTLTSPQSHLWFVLRRCNHHLCIHPPITHRAPGPAPGILLELKTSTPAAAAGQRTRTWRRCCPWHSETCRNSESRTLLSQAAGPPSSSLSSFVEERLSAGCRNVVGAECTGTAPPYWMVYWSSRSPR